MEVFVKNFSDFKTTALINAEDWKLPLASMENESGTVTLPRGERKDFSGDWVYIGNHLFIVDESSPDKSTVSLTVSDPANMFKRELVFPAEPKETFGEFIADVIETEFINCSDPEYRISYLRVTNTDTTEIVYPEINEAGFYSLVELIYIARKYGVVMDFAINGENLDITIRSYTSQPHNIVFSDGHSDVESETFSNVNVAKVSIYKETNTEGVYSITDYYLDTDGEIHTEPPEKRPKGDWKLEKIGKDDDAYAKAKEIFDDNIASHKIEFYSDNIYQFWDIVKFKIDGEIFLSNITSIFLSSDNKRYLYTAGDLATTLTEIVKRQ